MSSGGGSASTAASIEADAALYRAKVDELRSQIDEEALHALDFNPASKETVYLGLPRDPEGAIQGRV